MTPFSIQGQATDPNMSDNLTYIWEQIDEDGPDTLTKGFIGMAASNSAIAPLFRSYPPSTTGNSRIFPALNFILNNSNTSDFEALPNVGRTINLRLIARDNNASNGGFGSDDLQLTVNGNAGPLAVTSPNTNVNWATGSQNITWDVNNTNTMFSTVDILLSVDGGNSYPYVLATNTPNDGTQSVSIPLIPTSSAARIKVRYAPTSCFEIFDMSNSNFTISSSCIATSSNICQTNSLNANFGDPSLNLGLSPVYGTPFNSKQMTTSGSTVNVAYNLTPASVGTGNCTEANFGYSSYFVKFKITNAGNHTFSMSGARPLTVYNGDYISSSACTNYIGSTAYDIDGLPYGTASFNNQMTLNLTNICGDYTAVLFRENGQSLTLNITGPDGSTIYEIQSSTSGNLYTYLAVNDIDNKVEAISANSDFRTLGSGSYCVYGIDYNASINPNSWVGQTLSGVLSGGGCMLSSANCKPISITCGSTNISSSGDAGIGTLRDAFDCHPEGAIITYNSGVNSTLSSPIIFDKNATIVGTSNNVIQLNFSGPYGFHIPTGKTLTLKNLELSMVGVASPVVLNEGTLILENVKIIGNTAELLENKGNVVISGTQPTVIKKI